MFDPRGDERPTIVEWLEQTLRPPSSQEVLLPGETAYYRESLHWVQLGRPTLEAVSAVQLGIWVMYDEPFGFAWLLTVWAIFSTGILLIYLRALFGDAGSQEVSPEVRRQRQAFIAGVATVAFVVSLTGTGLRGLVWGLMAFMVLRVFHAAIVWRWYRVLYVTDRRVMQTEGVLNRSIASLPLGRVTDARVKETAAGNYLGYGEFHVETAGQKQALAHLQYLRDPRRFNKVLLSLAIPERAATEALTAVVRREVLDDDGS